MIVDAEIPSAYPFKETAATEMLSAGLEHTTATRRISLRKLGKELGYKQAVALSHMASGRIPIPVERAVVLAEVLAIDQDVFLLAVLAQRYPSIRWDQLFERCPQDTQICYQGILAGISLAELTVDQRAVAEELVRDTHPRERWLAIPEIAVLATIRTHRPQIAQIGLAQNDYFRIKAALDGE